IHPPKVLLPQTPPPDPSGLHQDFLPGNQKHD
ncbi:hypothetical protein Tco_0636531, partial [Tanacetum coccineum]